MGQKNLFILITVLLAGCAEMMPSQPGSMQTVFEDPDGTRILYDAGRTVRGPNDPRLGKIDAVLVSQVHGDHLGGTMQFDGGGRCVSGC